MELILITKKTCVCLIMLEGSSASFLGNHLVIEHHRGAHWIDRMRGITFVVTMPIKTKIRKIGNSYGIVLPKEALHTLKVEEGSTVYLTEAPNNTLNINPGRPGFDEIMQVAEEGVQRYRNTLRELAK
jgi:putative addiction module antidote